MKYPAAKKWHQLIPAAFFLFIYMLSLSCHSPKILSRTVGQDPSSAAVQFGRTVNKQPVLGYQFGHGSIPVLIISGIHGNEVSGVELGRAIVDSLLQTSLNPQLALLVIPVANPDGYRARTRYNANTVDLNRNFATQNWQPENSAARLFSGTAPASEPETRILQRIITRRQPQLIISIHSPLACVNWDGPATKLAEQLAEKTNYPTQRDIGYPTPGSFGTYAGVERQIPTITLELNRYETPAQIGVCVTSIIEIINSFLQNPALQFDQKQGR